MHLDMFFVCNFGVVLNAMCEFLQANDILSSFDDRLRVYATKQLTKVKKKI